MSEATATVDAGATRAAVPADAGRRRRPVLKPLLLAALVLFLLVFPLYFDEFWLRMGFAVSAAVVGAIGLNLLVGNTGQLSLAHAFFLAVGAVTYVFVSAEGGAALGVTDLAGLGLPPVVGMIAGVLAAGLAGLLFSPISARLGGIYLGVASLALVFIGQHLFNSWTSVTGGFNGRPVPEFELFGFSFGNDDPELYVMGVPFRESERLWYLGLVIAIGAYIFAHNVLRSRPGRAIQTLRDSETAASVMGVNVQAYKARSFMLSSMYAGLAGVLYALSIGSIAPESFGLLLSVSFLAMIVLGGLGSVAGATLGAFFVTALPLAFQQYADVLPMVSGAGQGGIAAGEAALYLYGLAIILVILFEPAGLAGLARRVSSRFGRAGRAGGKVTRPPTPSTTDPST